MKYQPHEHTPVNVNTLIEFRHKTSDFNNKIAILLTKGVGTMVCAYAFAVLALLGMPGLFPPYIAQWVQWISQTFIQLVMLSILMVGQRLLSGHQEASADEQYPFAKKVVNDLETIIRQNNELLKGDTNE